MRKQAVFALGTWLMRGKLFWVNGVKEDVCPISVSRCLHRRRRRRDRLRYLGPWGVGPDTSFLTNLGLPGWLEDVPY